MLNEKEMTYYDHNFTFDKSEITDLNEWTQFETNYGYLKKQLVTLKENLINSIASAHVEKSGQYWQALTDTTSLLLEGEEQWQAENGPLTLPPRTFFVECDERGNFPIAPVPSLQLDGTCIRNGFSIPINPELLSPFYNTGKAFRYLFSNNAPKHRNWSEDKKTIDAIRLFGHYSHVVKVFKEEKYKGSNDVIYADLETELENTAWKLLHTLYPRVENHIGKVKKRLGFNGILAFIESLYHLRPVNDDFSQTSLYHLQQNIEQVYNKYELVRSAPHHIEETYIKNISLKQFSEDEVKCRYLLNAPY